MDNFIVWSPGVTLEDIERQVIEKAHAFYKGNKTATSNALGISIRNLDMKLDKYMSETKMVQNTDAEREARARTKLAQARGHLPTPPMPSPPPRRASESLARESQTTAQVPQPTPVEQPAPAPAKRPDLSEVLSRRIAANTQRGRS